MENAIVLKREQAVALYRTLKGAATVLERILAEQSDTPVQVDLNLTLTQSRGK